MPMHVSAGMNVRRSAAKLLGRELHGMFVERREVSARDDVRRLTVAQLHEQMAAVESMGEPEFAAKIRRMGKRDPPRAKRREPDAISRSA